MKARCPRPVGGTHERTKCNYCGGAWQRAGDGLAGIFYARREDFSAVREQEFICDTCIQVVLELPLL